MFNLNVGLWCHVHIIKTPLNKCLQFSFCFKVSSISSFCPNNATFFEAALCEWEKVLWQDFTTIFLSFFHIWCDGNWSPKEKCTSVLLTPQKNKYQSALDLGRNTCFGLFVISSWIWASDSRRIYPNLQMCATHIIHCVLLFFMMCSLEYCNILRDYLSWPQGFREHILIEMESRAKCIPSFWRFLGRCPSSLGNFMTKFQQFPVAKPLKLHKIFLHL